MAPKFSFRSLCPSRSAVSPSPASADRGEPELAQALRRGRWLKLLLKLHWISSAICLLGMLLFSVTGLTLNHAAQIEAKPKIVRSKQVLPAALLATLADQAAQAEAGKSPLPPPVVEWVAGNFHVDVRDAAPEWSADEVYLPLPRPGGDAWLRIALEDGEVEHELTDRGWISWLNDLHKGRHAGSVWSLFIDVFAAACLFFSLTGLLLLKMHAAQRASTWPLVGLGVVVPLLIALLFIH